MMRESGRKKRLRRGGERGMKGKKKVMIKRN